ncbi:hypothetical protein L0F63_004661 [Massospora cicadina]|nr:hypothetical protein L0F63_004661 [Massospora cicadina]
MKFKVVVIGIVAAQVGARPIHLERRTLGLWLITSLINKKLNKFGYNTDNNNNNVNTIINSGCNGEIVADANLAWVAIAIHHANPQSAMQMQEINGGYQNNNHQMMEHQTNQSPPSAPPTAPPAKPNKFETQTENGSENQTDEEGSHPQNSSGSNGPNGFNPADGTGATNDSKSAPNAASGAKSSTVQGNKGQLSGDSRTEANANVKSGSSSDTKVSNESSKENNINIETNFQNRNNEPPVVVNNFIVKDANQAAKLQSKLNSNRNRNRDGPGEYSKHSNKGSVTSQDETSNDDGFNDANTGEGANDMNQASSKDPHVPSKREQVTNEIEETTDEANNGASKDSRENEANQDASTGKLGTSHAEGSPQGSGSIPSEKAPHDRSTTTTTIEEEASKDNNDIDDENTYGDDSGAIGELNSNTSQMNVPDNDEEFVKTYPETTRSKPNKSYQPPKTSNYKVASVY